MNVVDKNDDISKLEEIFGVEVIEQFIRNLAGQLDVIDMMKHLKPWEIEEGEDEVDKGYLKEVFSEDIKQPKYARSERTRKEFVDL